MLNTHFRFFTISVLTIGLFAIGTLALAGENPRVKIDTNYGAIELELYADEAPETVANFLQYVDSGFYQDTIFHRVIDGFMIQGGGFDAKYNQKPTRTPIKNEADNGLSNARGTVAMARTNQPHSATAQFFINTADNQRLDYNEMLRNAGYCVFGRVLDGMSVVDEIAQTPTGPGGPFRSDVPQGPIIIKDITRIIAKAKKAEPAPNNDSAEPKTSDTKTTEPQG